jgi:hypothetical protein
MVRFDFLNFFRVTTHIDDDGHYKLARLNAATLLKVNPGLMISSAEEIAFAISHIFKASALKSPYLNNLLSEKLLKRDHDYQHSSQIQNKYLEYDSTFNRLSTYLVTDPDIGLHNRIISRKFIEPVQSSVSKRNLKFTGSGKWLQECQSIIKRDYTESNHSIVAGDAQNLWTLWSRKAGEYLAIFKDLNSTQTFSFMIKRVSDET